MDKFLWYIIKHCILFLDRDNTFLAHSFSKDDKTDFHIIKEQFLEDRYCYGTKEELYR